MKYLPDGSYDVVVVDVEMSESGDLHIEVTITLGSYVGHVIPLRQRHVDENRPEAHREDPLNLLGVPGTLRVRDGVPSFRPERA